MLDVERMTMVMSESALKAITSAEIIEKGVEQIRSAPKGASYTVNLDASPNEFELVQTLFHRANAPYILSIQGNKACWTKG